MAFRSTGAKYVYGYSYHLKISLSCYNSSCHRDPRKRKLHTRIQPLEPSVYTVNQHINRPRHASIGFTMALVPHGTGDKIHLA